jgi:ribonuclease E
MAKKMLIDATHPEETRVVVVDGTKVEEFDFESLSKRQLAGNIYLAKVTRVEPSLQAAFVDYGGNRHGFLAFSEIHPDYYQIPVADREALLAEEREYAEAMAAEAEEEVKPKRRRSRRRKPNGTKAEATETDAVTRGTPSGMDVVDLDEIRGWTTRPKPRRPPRHPTGRGESAEDSPAAAGRSGYRRDRGPPKPARTFRMRRCRRRG